MRLRELSLARTQVTDSGLTHLRGLRELETLWLDNTQVTDTGINELKKALPNVYVDDDTEGVMVRGLFGQLCAHDFGNFSARSYVPRHSALFCARVLASASRLLSKTAIPAQSRLPLGREQLSI